MTTLFISDLHLDGSRPDITDQFLSFLDREAAQAEALYILGDLFEAWIGDDDPDPDKRRIVAAMKKLTGSGVPCFVMHGNRDFLLGKRFCADSGTRLIDDGTVVDLYGRRVLLLHGDTLCTDDPAYQRLRRIVRNPFVQFVLRNLTLRQRQRLAGKMRAGSKAHIDAMDKAAPSIMDVNHDAVAATFRCFGVDCMIHGHTHRPAVHRLTVDGHEATRIVLGDWYEQGSVLRWSSTGFELAGLARR
ncbi:MAG TPA: UDP-2,3-diacylglucosamine diphosphatase [Povalibacter sp.]|uniref:UDP-2,3-diacylglucosamine diphosphatase n=1 Tax=Povalibacter sp. TaxID=1962978 RepID=UPI002BA8E129|nr:UDP-2,3-diacylglucosamine diphosphatase [Povalibacter sp.]HMN45663.1 UDP-2,3-diacylglucosamine diphosphatase [Povalibacter sp.]